MPTLSSSFSTQHDRFCHSKNNYVCYDLDPVLTRPVSNFSFDTGPSSARSTYSSHRLALSKILLLKYTVRSGPLPVRTAR